MLFKTIHGSRLYGLHHDKSDYDYYTVLDKVKSNRSKYSKQKIIGNHDSMVVDFGTFIHFCEMGVPQALEAMFSQMAEVDEIKDFRQAYVATTGTHSRYLRTIVSFVSKQDYKKKRHALRLALNFVDLANTGRFNPTLTPNQVDYISDMAHRDTDKVYAVARSLAEGAAGGKVVSLL